MQASAKKILVKFLRGENPYLGKVDRRALANWITMFTMVNEFSDPATQLTSFDERNSLRMHRQPPSGWAIWIGTNESLRWHGATSHLAWKEPSELGIPSEARPEPVAPALTIDCQTTAGALGRLFMMSFSTALSGVPLNDISKLMVDRYGLISIWPAREGLVRCRDLGMGDFEAAWVSTALTTMPRRLIYLPWEHEKRPQFR